MRLVGNTHLVEGTAEVIPEILSMLAKEGIETRGNPDIYVREYQSFGIEEAREIRDRSSLRAVGSHRVFIIATSGMTHEAQNALLKTLEEPAANAHFFFILPSPHMLLPTLRSRAQILPMSHIHTVERARPAIDPVAFLGASPLKRIDMLKPLLEKGDDDRRDMPKIITFLSLLEKNLEKSHDGLKAIYRARKYIGDKGALVKPLLEQVALLVPRM